MKFTAYAHGAQMAAYLEKKNPTADAGDIILNVMSNNPYTTNSAKKKFIDGASEHVNMTARMKTRQQVYGEA